MCLIDVLVLHGKWDLLLVPTQLVIIANRAMSGPPSPGSSGLSTGGGLGGAPTSRKTGPRLKGSRLSKARADKGSNTVWSRSSSLDEKQAKDRLEPPSDELSVNTGHGAGRGSVIVGRGPAVGSGDLGEER